MKKFTELLVEKQNDLYGAKPVAIAFLGDSVTQGCFEVYRKSDGGIETFFESQNAYSAKLRQIFAEVCPRVPVNVINAGISGGSAPNGLERLERDVLRYRPDLAVVCFGLNDCTRGMEGIADYENALAAIFDRLREAGIEAILMTPNRICNEVSCHVSDEMLRGLAATLADIQNSGVLDAYVEAAKRAAHGHGARVCDCYTRWQRMKQVGLDTTALLSNHLNHPTREMHWLFANALFECILSGEDN